MAPLGDSDQSRAATQHLHRHDNRRQPESDYICRHRRIDQRESGDQQHDPLNQCGADQSPALKPACECGNADRSGQRDLGDGPQLAAASALVEPINSRP